MKVNLFNCARKKLNKTVLVLGLGLGIGMGGEAEASTTYSGTLTADSPSFSQSPTLHYKAYTLKGQTGVTYTLSIPESVTAYSYKNYFDPTDMSANTKTDLFNDDQITGTSHYYIIIVGSVGSSYSITTSAAFNPPANVDVNGIDATYSNFNSKGNITNGGSSPANLTIDNPTSQSYVFSTSSAGQGINNFIKSGIGTLTLLGQNQHTGSTTVNGGTLSVASGSIPSGSTINLSGGKLGAAASFTLPNSVVLNQASTIDAQGQDLVLSGTISGNYGLTITSSGGSNVGSVSLTGSNTYTGATTVSGGTLKLSASPTTSGSQITFSGGSFKAGSTFTMNNSVVVNSTTFDTNGSNVTLSGQLSGTNFTKSGTGTLTLSGTSNLSSGTITVSAGTLAIQSEDSLGDENIDISLNGGTLKAVGTVSPTAGNSISVNSDSSIDTNGNTYTLLGSLTVASGKIVEFKDSGSGGVFDVTGASSVSSTGTIKITGGTYRINAASQLGGGATTLNGGTLKLTASSITLPTLSITDNSTVDIDTYGITMTNPITGSSGKVLTKVGTSTMILSATNSFAGGALYATAGELRVSNPTTQLSGASYVKLGNGANLNFTAGGVLPCALVL